MGLGDRRRVGAATDVVLIAVILAAAVFIASTSVAAAQSSTCGAVTPALIKSTLGLSVQAPTTSRKSARPGPAGPSSTAPVRTRGATW